MPLIQSPRAPSGGKYAGGNANATRELSLVLLGSLVIGLVACSRDSLWIDEAWMGILAAQPSLGSWWRTLREISGSTLQMPVYALVLWGWEKLVGDSEWALRAANIPFFCIGNFALWKTFPRDRGVRLAVVGVAALSPFLWFYLNEARPYLMQYAGSCLVILGLARLAAENRGKEFRNSFWILGAGVGVLCGSSLLAVPWAATAGAAALYLIRERRSVARLREAWLPLLCVTVVASTLGPYYLWTLLGGARASEVGHTTYRNIFFTAGELLGFSGLGPGRLEIRAREAAALLDFVAPLVLLGVIMLVVFMTAARSFAWREYRRPLIAGTIYAVAAIVVTILASAGHFRLLGRHLMPVEPLICISVAMAAIQVWQTRVKLAVVALGLLWLCSSLSLRFAPRHRKDDYRSAAGIARAAVSRGQRVWWSADWAGARYYGLVVERGAPEPGQAESAANLQREDLQRREIPQMIVTSKPDIYDSSGVLAGYLASEKFAPVKNFRAFTIWTR